MVIKTGQHQPNTPQTSMGDHRSQSQGMTLDIARIDLTKAFVPGMGYVALSRVKSYPISILPGLIVWRCK
ncbi:hypothetical protein IPF89_00225 [Candidatus Saccharibacteria bacterium]|nr:MAG: hypothetical protein IPF89_00225 [Candidatus Saccharibacteria bacterium]